MANRRLFQFQYSYERDLVHIFAQLTVGSTGAVSAASGKGLSSITRNSAGDYTIKLQDTFNTLLDVGCTVINASGISASPNMGIKANNITTGSIEVVFSTGGVATDPASGDVITFHIVARNAST